jgi:dimethylargininase
VEGVPLGGCLHLKSAVTQVGPQLLLINPAYVNPDRFADMQFVEVDPGEPLAANAVLIGREVIYPASNPRTAQRLRQRGITVHTVDVSELEKAEGAVTCCSLVFSA